MPEHNRAPALSVILPTSDDFAGVRLTVRALAEQTVCDQIELVLISPHDELLIDESEVSGFHSVTVVNGGPLETSNKWRAIGIRAASAPVVVMAEDHSFPDPGWAEALLAPDWSRFAVVGPVIQNANPRSMMSWANLLLEYGPWLEGAGGGEVIELPGHNSAYRRDLLISYGDNLEQIFEVESVVQRDLRARGHALFLQSAARTHHLNFSRLAPSLLLRVNGGRSFAGHRVLGWSATKRILYAAGSPLIPFVRFVRVLRFLAQSDRYRYLLPQVIPALALSLAEDGLGEFLGYITGPGESPVRLGEIEFDRMRFLDRRDRALLERRLTEPVHRCETVPAMAG